jgi:arylsulfatase A-like enzyme
VPGGVLDQASAVVSIVDMAPTIMSVAGAASPEGFDGQGFGARLEPRISTLGQPRNEAVYLEWVGDAQIPAWAAVRTSAFKLVRYEDGFEELYDIAGRVGPPDPWEMDNRVTDPRYGGVLARLRRLLGRYERRG